MLVMVSPKGSEATIMFDIYFGLDRGRGLYFTLFREKPPEKKLLFLADFIKN